MSNKKISIIMSAYNEKKEWLSEAIESILDQTYYNYEFIIIMDNPNNYELIELIEKYAKYDMRIKLYINKINRGLVYSLNKALSYATGDYIARMDADDISCKERLKSQVKFLENNTQIDLCATGVVIMDEFGRDIYNSNIYGQTHKSAGKSLIYRNIFPHGSWMFRSKILNDLKGYNDVEQAEDYDFLFRLISKGYKVSVIPEYYFKYRLRENGISFKNLYKQKLIMNKISREYKQSIRNKIQYKTSENINDFIASEKEIENYNISQNLYTKGIKHIRGKKFIKGILELVISLSKCKYKREEIKAIFMLKVVNKIYK